MATLMLIVIYTAFIGLGVPDSLFGTAWPEIYSELSLPVSSAGIVSVIISSMTMISGIMSAHIISRFGTYAVTVISTFVTAVSLLGFSFSDSFWWLCLLAIPLGLGAGAIDSGLNAYVALHFSASHMSFLHCAYGVGVMCGPYIMSYIMKLESGWRGGYRVAVVIQLFIALVCAVSYPLWKKTDKNNASGVDDEKNITVVPVKKLAENPKVCLAWLMFFGSCAVECTCGAWGATYLVVSRGMPAYRAAFVLALYYSGIMLSRLISGFANKKTESRLILLYGEIIAGAAIIMLILPLPVWASAVALFLIGFGNGPLYPNLMALTPKNFGTELARSVMGTQVAAASLGVMAMPPLFGFLFGEGKMHFFPYYMLIMFIILAIPTVLMYVKPHMGSAKSDM